VLFVSKKSQKSQSPKVPELVFRIPFLFFKLLLSVADDYTMVGVAESKWKLASRKASILSFEH